MTYWFTSDFHLGQRKILEYDQRPFDTIEDHDLTIIENMNMVVKPDDHVYYLGDFSMQLSTGKLEEYLGKLNGKWFFILGNHDHNKIRRLYEKYGTLLGRLHTFKHPSGQTIELSHFSLRTWSRHHRGSYHLYGHSHGSLPPLGRSMDVGVNTNGYFPYSYEDIVDIMEPITPHVVDHHVN